MSLRIYDAGWELFYHELIVKEHTDIHTIPIFNFFLLIRRVKF
jgi:hypothetical protein